MAPAALIEVWTLYAIGTTAIMLRVFVRIRMVGIQGFCPDDYLIWFSWGCYTAMTVAAHIVGGVGDTSHLTAEQRLTMPPAQVAARQLGTKWFLVGWYTYIGLIWTLKLNMLFLYRRVAGAVNWIHKAIVPSMVLVVASGVSIWILLASACRPFHKLWQIYPDPGPHCFPQAPVFLITILVLNLFTDLILFVIPIPIIVPLQISTGRKIGLIFLFAGAIFTMTAAILRVYFVLAQQKGETAAIWSCREDVIAIVIGQATFIRSFFTPSFWGVKTVKGSSGGGTGNSSQRTHELVTIGGGGAKNSRSRGGRSPYNLTVLETRTESEEKMIENQGQQDLEGGDPCKTGIEVHTTIDQESLVAVDQAGRGDSSYRAARPKDV